MDEIKTINIQDKNYPKLLKEIKDPPEILYVRGEILPDDSFFAVVGTRMASSYGKQVALEIAGDLAEAGLTIVSGMAPGIDTFCHQATLERKGRTIAVLGTGLDEKSIYPQSNLKLAEKILKTGGALISEYPPGTPGSKFTFPQRNRIISGLSLGVLVVEAKQKSGALITAHHAFSQNRKVFAVPGPIHSSNSKGPHYLIKKGA
ncbi:MAG: DNA-protecting protein DprA, partial [Candidatus Nealsonbacteria bacterium CG10_big_fil_rev_8_21_14_0_10_37_25]